MSLDLRRLAPPALAALAALVTGLAGAADFNLGGPAVRAPVVQQGDRSYDYTARTRARAAEQGTVTANGIDWQCEGRECTATGPWPTPGVEACRALAGRVGEIVAYGHPDKQLSGGQLAECNRGVAKRDAAPPATAADVGPRVQAPVPSGGEASEPTDDDADRAPASLADRDHSGDLSRDDFERRKREAGVREQQGRVLLDRDVDEGSRSGLIEREADADLGERLSRDDDLAGRADVSGEAAASTKGGFLPEVPVPEGDGPERDTPPGGFSEGDARERVARAAHHDGPFITGIDEFDASRSCTGSRTITLRGRDFGEVQQDNRLMLAWSDDARGRERPFTAADVRHWSDEAIVVRLPQPSVLGPGAVHYIGIWDGRGELVSNLESNELCYQRFTVRGRIELENCNADPVNDVRIVVDDETRDVTYQAPVSRVPGEDMVAQYELTRISPRSLRVRAELDSPRCPGGDWLPVETASVSLSQYTPEVERHFRYRVERQTARLPLRLVLGMINSQFRGTSVKVHNYAGGPPDGGSYLDRDASLMELSDELGGAKYTFTVPEQRKGRRRWYVRDIHSEGDPRVTADGDAVTLTMRFESAGGEIKGHCRVHGRVFGWRDCPLGSDKGAPDGHIDNMVWRIRLGPIVHDDSIAFEVLDVEMDADIQMGGICKVGSNVGSDRDVCSVLTSYRSQIRNGAEAAVATELSRDHVRQTVADAFRDSLSTLHRITDAEYPVRELIDVRIDDGDLVLEYWPDEA